MTLVRELDIDLKLIICWEINEENTFKNHNENNSDEENSL